MKSTTLDSNEVKNFSDSGNAQSQLIAENKDKVGGGKSAIRFKHIQFFKIMSKDNTELIEFAKSIYRPRVCPFCESKEDLSDSILVEIYRGADIPEFKCSCEDFKKAVARAQIEEYTQIIKSLLPKRFKDCSLENYIGHDKLKTNLKELINKQESILITGTVGTGKTHLAVACLKEFLISRNNRNDRFVMTSLSAVLADVYSNAAALKPVQKCELLLIDDLGVESVKEWSMEKIYDIINYRYENMLPIIITTNLTSNELKAKIGIRSFSRIMSMCKPFVVNGEDYRIRHLK